MFLKERRHLNTFLCILTRITANRSSSASYLSPAPVLFRASSSSAATDVEEVELEGVFAATVGLVAADEFGQQVELLLGQLARRLLVHGVARRGGQVCLGGGGGVDARRGIGVVLAAGGRHLGVDVPESGI